MAIVTGRLAAISAGLATIDLVFDDATGAISGARVTNNTARTLEFGDATRSWAVAPGVTTTLPYTGTVVSGRYPSVWWRIA